MNNIPYGQFRRIRRNCTKNGDFKEQSKILTERLIEKGYPKKIITEAKDRATKMSQASCIQPKDTTLPAKQPMEYKHAFITTYNHNQRYIRQTLNKHWNVLKNDPYLKELISTKSHLIFRRSRTLKNVLAPSRIDKKRITTKHKKK